MNRHCLGLVYHHRDIRICMIEMHTSNSSFVLQSNYGFSYDFVLRFGTIYSGTNYFVDTDTCILFNENLFGATWQSNSLKQSR